MRCRDCKVPLTRRVTYSTEMTSFKGIARCGPCYLRNRRSFRFRKTVKKLVAVVGEDLIAACILEVEE